MTGVRDDIGAQIEEFLRRTLNRTKPQWIVTVERKGTALLRTLVESERGPGPDWLGWERVLSHEALTDVHTKDLQDGAILLLDDSVARGRKIAEVAAGLVNQKKVPKANIKIAAFAVHERCELSDFEIIHWFGQLDDDRYKEVRNGIIEFFQHRGSLLLDTEHIEVPVDLKCGRIEFFEALSKAGTAIEHVCGGRTNLTIVNPTVLDEAVFRKSLPEGTLIKDCVRKIRVVEREKNRYAIIPIFYPSIPTDTTRESLGLLDSSLPSLAATPERNFHLVGVFAAMELFRTVFAALRDLVREEKVWVRNPLPRDADDCLSHLKVLFPTIDIEALHRSIQDRIDAGLSRRPRKGELKESFVIDAVSSAANRETMDKLLWLLLIRVLHYSDRVPAKPSGAMLPEIMSLICEKPTKDSNVQIARALLSAVMDQAIDSANVAAGVADVMFDDRRRRMVRVFTLDNEVVHSQVSKAAAMWRFSVPWGEVHRRLKRL